MESEEAILENDNNFNVELESTLRDRDQAGEELLDNVGCGTSSPRDISPPLDMQDESDVVMSDDTLKGAEHEELGLSSCGTEELMAEVEGFKNEEAAVTTTPVVESRDESIQDYEDFIGNDDTSQQQEIAQFTVTEHVDSLGKVHEVALDLKFPEPMDIDSCEVDYADTYAANIPSEIESENIGPSVQNLHSDDEERDLKQCAKNTIKYETSKEADTFRMDQSGSSRDVLPEPVNRCDELLEENFECAASGKAVLPVFRQYNEVKNAFNEAYSLVENEKDANKEGFSNEDRVDGGIVVDSSEQNKGDDAEAVSSHQDNEDYAEVVGSPHHDKESDAEDVSPYQPKGDVAEVMSSPQDKGDNAEVVGSPHGDGGDTKVVGFPYRDREDAEDAVSPHQHKGDGAEDMDRGDGTDIMVKGDDTELKFPHGDEKDDAEVVGSPHQDKKDAEDSCSPCQDNEDFEDMGSPHQDKEDAEDMGSPHHDKEDAEDVGSSHQDEEDAEDMGFPHKDEEDVAEIVGSPYHKDKGDVAEDVCSPHHDKEDAEDMGSPHQDKGDVAKDIGSPQDKGDDAEVVGSFQQDKGEDAEVVSTPQDKDTNVEFVNSSNEDIDNVEGIDSLNEERYQNDTRINLSKQDRGSDLTRVELDSSLQDGGKDLTAIDFLNEDKEEALLSVDSSKNNKEDDTEVAFSYHDKEDGVKEGNFSEPDREDDAEVEFSHDKDILKGLGDTGLNKYETVADIIPANQDGDDEVMNGAQQHKNSDKPTEFSHVLGNTDTSSDEKLDEAGTPKNDFEVALEGEYVTKEANSKASGSNREVIRSESPRSRVVEATDVMDEAEASADNALPCSFASDECQNQESIQIDGVTEAETHVQVGILDGDKARNVESAGNTSSALDECQNQEGTHDDVTELHTQVNVSEGDRTSNYETFGEASASITSAESRQILSSESDTDTIIEASVHGDKEDSMEVTTENIDIEPTRLQSVDKTVLSEISYEQANRNDAKDNAHGEHMEESSNPSKNLNRTLELMDVDESTVDSSDAAPKIGVVETTSLLAAGGSSEGNNTKDKGTFSSNTDATSDRIASPLTQDTSSTVIIHDASSTQLVQDTSPTQLAQDTSLTHLIPDNTPTSLVPDTSTKLKEDPDLIPKTQTDSGKTESDSYKTQVVSGQAESDSDKTQVVSGQTESDSSKSMKKEAVQKSEIQPSTEQAPPVNTKRPQRARRTGSRIGDKAAVILKEKEALETKSNENGLQVEQPAASKEEQLLDDEDKGTITLASSDTKTASRKSKSSRSRTQTCLVCQKICKCKYNIVRNGDVKHLCDDPCFKQFKKTPSVFLKGPDNSKSSKKSLKASESPSPVQSEEPVIVDPQEMEPQPNATYKTCAVCQLLNLNASQPFCNWKGLDFCGEPCLGKFQANLNSVCSFCHAAISVDSRPGCCVKIGADMHLFCKPRCCSEFKKKLRLCSFCQRDVSGILGAFTAMVGKAGKLKEFCSQVCMRKLESRMKEFDLLPIEKGSSVTCSTCRRNKHVKYNVWLKGKLHAVCSDACFSSFKYTNNISMDSCASCGTVCFPEETQTHFVQYAGQLKQFCSDACVSNFCKANSRLESCGLCGIKKMNFDMIERQDAENKFMMFCSLNCLALCQVQIQTKTGQPVTCDQCRKVEPAQYHLTMSDASIRNYCSYSCVLMATNRKSPGALATSAPNRQPQQLVTQTQQQKIPPSSSIRGRGGRSAHITTRQAAARQQSETVPVISSVVSLASSGEPHQQRQPSLKSTPNPPQPAASSHPFPSQIAPSPASSQTPPPHLTTPGTARTAAANNMVPSADGKHQILIQSPPPKVGKNKSLQCKPATQSKATSCKPHSQTRETQTDEIPPKTVIVPVPVPVYLPMPTVMFTAPAPKLIPVPIPIPVPIFIPTTRKSVNGILKTIQDILERMPADPLEAELLMMAEAVAADGRPGDSDTDSEADALAEDFSVPVEEDVLRPAPREDDALLLRKRERQGEEDMIQMALRMAEEMSGPIEDLETSVEPVAVSSEAPPQQQHLTLQSYETQAEDDYIPPRSVPQRVPKRPSRGRTPVSRAKKPRLEQPFHGDSSMQSQIQSMEPPPDANFRLKFTYGVHAWRHWIAQKNSEVEKAKQATGNYKLRNFPSDLLKCTTEDLNNTLCMFIREVRKPNGDEYSPDSIYYLCLGIQQYLFENGRIENIFTDIYFEKFTDRLNESLKTLRPKINSQGQMLCRIEEEHLWESKQLGAHSPFILLNTLIYFHTKHFILKTAQEHLSLSFAQILKHWKKGVPLKGPSAASGKNVSLRFYCLANGKKDGLAARKNKDGLPVYEVTENFDNPLRCPVKLYEFFLSKCPESIKNRNDIFYPVPERSCVPDSPVWYSTQSIDVHTMDKMLTRVLLVREIQEAHLHAQPIYM